MKGELSQERYIQVTNANKLSKSLLFVNMLEFLKVFGKHYAKGTKNVKNITTTLLFGKLKLQ